MKLDVGITLSMPVQHWASFAVESLVSTFASAWFQSAGNMENVSHGPSQSRTSNFIRQSQAKSFRTTARFCTNAGSIPASVADVGPSLNRRWCNVFGPHAEGLPARWPPCWCYTSKKNRTMTGRAFHHTSNSYWSCWLDSLQLHHAMSPPHSHSPLYCRTRNTWNMVWVALWWTAQYTIVQLLLYFYTIIIHKEKENFFVSHITFDNNIIHKFYFKHCNLVTVTACLAIVQVVF